MLTSKIKKKIIIGSWSWSGMYKRISKSEVNRIIDLCLSNKFYEFDTSPSYKKADNILSYYKKKKLKDCDKYQMWLEFKNGKNS